jgi:hypothetical protein
MMSQRGPDCYWATKMKHSIRCGMLAASHVSPLPSFGEITHPRFRVYRWKWFHPTDDFHALLAWPNPGL